jgi:hypothetical protein
MTMHYDEWEPSPDDAPVGWLATALAAEPVTFMLARQAFAQAGGGDAGTLAVRRLLDGELRETAGWPRAGEYRQAAADLAAIGKVPDAEMLSMAASADHLLRIRQDRWVHRYDNRTETPREEVLRWLLRAGWFDLDPAGPYVGVDGVDYEPGVQVHGREGQPVVVVTSRAMREVITGWRDYEQARQWVASRGSTGSGDLDGPSAVTESRLGREERVLAFLMVSGRAVGEVAAMLPPETFTSDVRYDLYAAMTTVAARDGRCAEPALRRELARRAAWVPDHALPAYLALEPYLSRLASTHVSRDSAMQAAEMLLGEDAAAVRLRARPGSVTEAVPGVMPVVEPSPDRGLEPEERGPRP